MENAVKALIIAAGMLIAIIILSIGIYLFNMYSDFAYNQELNRIKQAQVQENMKFEKYNGEQMTFQDVITLANLAHDYNDRKSDKHIAVICNGENLAEKSRTELSNKLKNITDNNEYKISNIEYYPDSDYAIIKTITIVQGKVERAY